MIVNLNFTENEPVFYYYHNWTANQTNKIHSGSCGFCVYSSGRNVQPVNRGQNGVWIGPFSSIELAQQYVMNHFGHNTDLHDCI